MNNFENVGWQVGLSVAEARLGEAARVVTSAAVLCIATVGCVAAGHTDEHGPVADGDTSSESTDTQTGDRDFSEVDALIEGFLAEQGLEGATLAVVHVEEGLIYERGYGQFEAERVSLIASSSKALSAGILAHLADEGLLDLDAPISSYLPDWGAHKHGVTAAQLLSNSAGMPGLSGGGGDPYLPYLCQFTGDDLSACAEEIYAADDLDDLVEPDVEFRYGGGQWQLAGGLAQVVSGRTWEQLVEDVYVDPCELGTLGYVNHFAQVVMEDGPGAGLVYPSFVDGDISQILPTDNPNIEGGAYTTAGDYAKVLLMHLRGGRCGDTQVLSSQTVERMQVDRIAEVYGGSSIDETLPGYGMGWWLDRDELAAVAGGAYGAMPWIDAGRGYGAIFILEGDYLQGRALRLALRPMLDELVVGSSTGAGSVVATR